MNHHFDIEEACKHGVDAAIILSNLRFWLAKNYANKTNIHEGYVWTYNSARAFSELFPYWTANKIQKLLKKMELDGIIISGNFNKAGYDRKKWYTTSEFKIQPNGSMDLAKLLKANGEKAEPIADIKPDDKPDVIKPSKARPQSAKEAQDYFEERGWYEAGVGERFFDHYESIGWKRGKNLIKDWKATVRTWIKNNESRGIKPPQQKQVTAEDEQKRKANEWDGILNL